MRIVTDDGVALEVVERGTGPALVLVHGFGGAKEDFSDQVDDLARDHRVVTLDLRGHGESDGPEETDRYSLDRFAADLGNVLDALDIGSCRLLGHSMGGMVVRRFVLGSPRRGRRAGPDGHLARPRARARRPDDGPRGADRQRAGHGRAEAGDGRVLAPRHARVPADAGRATRLPRVRRREVGGAEPRRCGSRCRSRSGTNPTSSRSWPRCAARPSCSSGPRTSRSAGCRSRWPRPSPARSSRSSRTRVTRRSSRTAPRG